VRARDRKPGPGSRRRSTSAPYTHAGGCPAPPSKTSGVREQLATTGVAGSRGRVPGRARV